MGMTASAAILAAVHRRSRTGEGADMKLAPADAALASVGNPGSLAAADVGGQKRTRYGNFLSWAVGAVSRCLKSGD